MPLMIGFKYCGGCNPRYDRKAFYEEFTSIAGDDIVTSTVKDGEFYDYIVVLSGCSSDCADCTRLSFKYDIIRVIQPKTPVEVLNCLLKK